MHFSINVVVVIAKCFLFLILKCIIFKMVALYCNNLFFAATVVVVLVMLSFLYHTLSLFSYIFVYISTNIVLFVVIILYVFFGATGGYEGVAYMHFFVYTFLCYYLMFMCIRMNVCRCFCA